MLIAYQVAPYVQKYKREKSEQAYLERYKPSSEVLEIARDAGLSESGKRIFFLSNPKILNAKNKIAEFCESIHLTAGSNIVTGCFFKDEIFLHRPANAEVYDLVVISAVHELLHAVYSRFDRQEKQKINQLLDQSLEGVDGPEIEKRISVYGNINDVERYNELYAIIGSEFSFVPLELENQYKQYFSRVELLKRHQKIQNINKSERSRIDEAGDHIQGLANEIKVREGQLAVFDLSLQGLKQRIEEMRVRKDVANFNLLAAEYNQQIEQFKKMHSELQKRIDEHNKLVAIRNQGIDQYNKRERSFDK